MQTHHARVWKKTTPLLGKDYTPPAGARGVPVRHSTLQSVTATVRLLSLHLYSVSSSTATDGDVQGILNSPRPRGLARNQLDVVPTHMERSTFLRLFRRPKKGRRRPAPSAARILIVSVCTWPLTACVAPVGDVKGTGFQKPQADVRAPRTLDSQLATSTWLIPCTPESRQSCSDYRERFVTDQATYTLAGPPELRWGNLKGMSA
jgi:hypothetical protein